MSEDTFHLGIKALLRNGGGEILLLRVNPAKLNGARRDYWDLPGGRVQKGQTVLDTLKREVTEETGITNVRSAKNIGMVLSNIRIPLSENETVGLVLGIHECMIPDGSNIVLSDEHIAYDWFTPKEAADLLAVKYPQYFCDVIAAL